MVRCDDPKQIMRAINAVMPDVPREYHRPFHEVILSYLHRYGIEGLQARIAGRSVATILQEFVPEDELDVVDSGERDGVRCRVLRRPEASDASNVQPDK